MANRVNHLVEVRKYYSALRVDIILTLVSLKFVKEDIWLMCYSFVDIGRVTDSSFA